MKKKPVSTPLLVVVCLLALAVGCAGTRKTAEPVFKGEPQGSPEAEAKLDPARITVYTSPYCLSRYPVLNIHHTSNRQANRNTQIIARLTPTLTSATSKKLQRKPLIR